MIEIQLVLSKISRFLDNFQGFQVGIVQNAFYVSLNFRFTDMIGQFFEYLLIIVQALPMESVFAMCELHRKCLESSENNEVVLVMRDGFVYNKIRHRMGSLFSEKGAFSWRISTPRSTRPGPVPRLR